jgi:hypothetical protein
MGEGEISHLNILGALLRHLGDTRYAQTLSNTSQRVREAVIALIDEDFRGKDYSKVFPKTYALAKHQNF